MFCGLAPSASVSDAADGSGTSKPATNLSISASSTSSSATTASSPPTGKVVPADATMRRNVPADAASTTLVIFGVSISRISSPSAKRWPCCLSQPTTVPSVMVRPHFGIVIAAISVIMHLLRHSRASVAQAGIQGFQLLALDPRFPRGWRDEGLPSLHIAVDFADRRGDPLGARDVEFFEHRSERHRGVRRGHPPD